MCRNGRCPTDTELLTPAGAKSAKCPGRVTASDGLLGIFAAMRPALLRYLAARGAGAAEAEDVLQDVYLTLHDGHTGPIAEPRAYLYRTATNRLLDHRRAGARRSQRERSWVELNSGTAIDEDGRPSAEAVLLGREQLAIVERHLAQLPERTTEIFRRFRVGGEAQRVIAGELGISVSAVEKHLQTAYRAVTAAKAALDAEPVARRRLIVEGNDDDG